MEQQPPSSPTHSLSEAQTSPPPAAIPVESKTSTLAIVALALAVIPCLNWVGLVLGIIAAIRIYTKRPQLKGNGLAIAAIIVGLAWIPVGLGAVAAIAVPNFVKFQMRSKQHEGKAELKTIHQAQRQFFLENGRYADTFAELQYSGILLMRYRLLMNQDEMPSPIPFEMQQPPELNTDFRENGFRVYAISNLDTDATLDIWEMTEESEEPVHLSDDSKN